MKSSLWDLKHGEKKENEIKSQNHEIIPMGFETPRSQARHTPSANHEIIPMGFETSFLYGFFYRCYFIMKSSLWDLKLHSIFSSSVFV